MFAAPHTLPLEFKRDNVALEQRHVPAAVDLHAGISHSGGVVAHPDADTVVHDDVSFVAQELERGRYRINGDTISAEAHVHPGVSEFLAIIGHIGLLLEPLRHIGRNLQFTGQLQRDGRRTDLPHVRDDAAPGIGTGNSPPGEFYVVVQCAGRQVIRHRTVVHLVLAVPDPRFPFVGRVGIRRMQRSVATNAEARHGPVPVFVDGLETHRMDGVVTQFDHTVADAADPLIGQQVSRINAAFDQVAAAVVALAVFDQRFDIAPFRRGHITHFEGENLRGVEPHAVLFHRQFRGSALLAVGRVDGHVAARRQPQGIAHRSGALQIVYPPAALHDTVFQAVEAHAVELRGSLVGRLVHAP